MFVNSCRNTFHTWLKVGDSLADTLDHSCTLVAQDDGEEALRVAAAQGVRVRVTHPSGTDLRSNEKKLEMLQSQKRCFRETTNLKL